MTIPVTFEVSHIFFAWSMGFTRKKVLQGGVCVCAHYVMHVYICIMRGNVTSPPSGSNKPDYSCYCSASEQESEGYQAHIRQSTPLEYQSLKLLVRVGEKALTKTANRAAKPAQIPKPISLCL